MRGRVVDVTTHAPIGGASLAIQNHPGVKAQTDHLGIFSFSRRHNFHLITYFNPLGVTEKEREVVVFPKRKHWPFVLTVTHPDYQPQHVSILNHTLPRNDSREPYELHDISLSPKPN